MDDLDEILRRLRENLNSDKCELRQAMQNFMQLTKVSLADANEGDSKSATDETTCRHDQSVGTSRPPHFRASLLPDNDEDDAMTLVAANGRRLAARSLPTSKALFMQTPKYGLPGLGEYEEKRKQYQQEWKKEYNSYLSEVAGREKQRKARQGHLDYEEVLSRKREEEWQYRHHNGGDPMHANGVMRPARSEGHLNQNVPDNYTHGFAFRNQNGGGPAAGRAGMHTSYDHHPAYDRQEYRRSEQGYPNDNDRPADNYSRPHSYPADTNIYGLPDGGYRGPDQGHTDGGRLYPPNYRNISNERVREQAEKRQRELYERDVDNYYRHHSQGDDIDVVGHVNGRQQQQHELETYNPGVRDARSNVGDTPYHRGATYSDNIKTEYQSDLARQVEDTKQRRQKEKEEQMKYDMKIEEEYRNYDPWGRGGAGAPVKDRQGNAITVRKQLGGNGETRHVSVVAPVMAPAFTDTSAAAYRAQETPALQQPNRASFPHLPRVEEMPDKRVARASFENYQEDLRRQIEDKKQRELEAKERDRLEEQRLMQKIEEENEQMQREQEEEKRKQKLKEEERRRRNEELLRRQQEQKKENERRAREESEQERKEKWEERERALGREPERSRSEARSPPIRTKHSPRTGSRNLRQKLNAAPGADPSKEHILGQLSAMRQQLEREQYIMQEQLQREVDQDSYEVFEKKRFPATNLGASYRENYPPPVRYHPLTEASSQAEPPLTPESPHLSPISVTPFVSPRRARQPSTPRSHRRPIVGMAALRATGSPKSLKGESFFLGVESDDRRDRRGNYDQWQQDSPTKTWNVYGDTEVEETVNKDAAKSEEQDADEMKDNSFIDEFMAKNLQRR